MRYVIGVKGRVGCKVGVTIFERVGSRLNAEHQMRDSAKYAPSDGHFDRYWQQNNRQRLFLEVRYFELPTLGIEPPTLKYMYMYDALPTAPTRHNSYRVTESAGTIDNSF